jgi:hypothetical protein
LEQRRYRWFSGRVLFGLALITAGLAYTLLTTYNNNNPQVTLEFPRLFNTAYGQEAEEEEEERHEEEQEEEQEEITERIPPPSRLILTTILHNKIGAFQEPRMLVHEYTDTGIEIIILIADRHEASQAGIREDFIDDFAKQYGYDLIVYGFTKATDELIVVLQEQGGGEEGEQQGL